MQSGEDRLGRLLSGLCLGFLRFGCFGFGISQICGYFGVEKYLVLMLFRFLIGWVPDWTGQDDMLDESGLVFSLLWFGSVRNTCQLTSMRFWAAGWSLSGNVRLVIFFWVGFFKLCQILPLPIHWRQNEFILLWQSQICNYTVM